MTTLYLAWSDYGNKVFPRPEVNPAELPVLVSYAFIDLFDRGGRSDHGFRCKLLDSGAYSVWSRGETVDIVKYAEETKKPRWNEAVALDVIGDWRGSERQAFQMLKMGSPAYPVFHYGEPFELLKTYCDAFWKVGLSCRFGESVDESWRWLEECFARQWPHRFHSFGYVEPRMLRTFPFHSADASSWLAGPRWGHWGRAFDDRMRLAGKDGYDATVAEVHAWTRLERELQSRWRKEMARWQ